MSVQLSMFAGAGWQFFDNNGVPLAGGLVYSYAAGTTTPAATYTTNSGSIAHSNPIVLDSAGRVPGGEVWLTAGSTYKFVLNTSAGVLIGTYDNIFADNGAAVLRSDLANTSDPTKGDALVGFRQSNAAGNLTGSVGRTVHQKLQEYISVKDFGATGDGSTNDTVAIQAAIDAVGAAGGTLWFPPGTYMIARNVGTNDHWGVKVPFSNVTLVGQDAYFERFNPDISTYALAYPLLFLGAPDSNSTPVSNITVQGIFFNGNNTNHGVSGSALNDNRCAIVFKNTSHTYVQNCKFFEIDSGALWYQQPVEYDYTNNVYYNTTKNYVSLIQACEFYVTPHAVPGRALVHAINAQGVDNCRILDNYFSWCDDCLSGETTYDGPLSNEDDVYTPTVSGWTLGAVKRTGRDWMFSNNNCYNSSEHAVYPAAVDVVISNNTFYSDEPTITANVDPVKIRSRNCSVIGNTIAGYGQGISVNDPSFNVTVSGNNIAIVGAGSEGGAIDVNSDGLAAYIAARSSYLTNYYPMWNIAITGNTVLFPTGLTAFQAYIGVRIYTDSYNATNYPNGQIQGLTISGNSFSNYKYGIYVINSQAKNIVVTGNSFFAKPFTTAGFSTSTTMNTEAVLLTYQSGSGESLTSFREMRFDNNMIWGAKYLFSTQNGGGGAGTIDVPWGMTGNKLNYIQYIKTADMRAFDIYNAFSKNVGDSFLDRSWGGTALDNSLGNGSTSNSFNRYTFGYDGTIMRFYTDDSATYISF
jgi:parallel beta-helix repeat protein